MLKNRYIFFITAGVGIIIIISIYTWKLVYTSRPEYYTKHFRQGMEYLKKKKYEKAIEEFKQSLKADTDSFKAHYGLGLAYLKKGQYEKAEDHLKKALKIRPERLDVRYSLGVAYQREERLERALDEYKKILKKNPRSFQVLNNIGAIQMKYEHFEKAEKALKRAIMIQPDYFPAHFNLAKLYELTGKKRLAVKEYKYIINRASLSPRTAGLAKIARWRLEKLMGVAHTQ